MKNKLFAIVTVGLLAGPMAAGALPVLDQQNVSIAGDALFTYGEEGNSWQQEVVVGIAGLLTGLEIDFLGGSGTLQIWLGSPWQGGAPAFSSAYSAANGLTFFDVSSAGLYLSNGQMFTFGIGGGDNQIRGSYNPGAASGNYVGGLFHSGVPGCYLDCGFDMGFRSYMDAGVGVPEPGTLALLSFGLAGLGFARRKKLH